MAIGHQLLADVALLVARLSPTWTSPDAGAQPPHAEGGEKAVVATGGGKGRARCSRRFGWGERMAGPASAHCRKSSRRSASLLARAVRRPYRIVPHTASAITGARARHGLEE